jgi:hypothetical protein
MISEIYVGLQPEHKVLCIPQDMAPVYVGRESLLGGKECGTCDMNPAVLEACRYEGPYSVKVGDSLRQFVLKFVSQGYTELQVQMEHIGPSYFEILHKVDNPCVDEQRGLLCMGKSRYRLQIALPRVSFKLRSIRMHLHPPVEVDG